MIMSKFQDLCGVFAKTGAFDQAGDPFEAIETAFDPADALRQIVGKTVLSGDYTTRYADPLIANISAVMGKLRNVDIIDVADIDDPETRRRMASDFGAMLLGVIVDRASPIAGSRAILRRLQCCIDGIFTATADRFSAAGCPPRTHLPPLANLSAGVWVGPHVKHIDRIRQFFLGTPNSPYAGSIGGIVGMPPRYGDHPLLWGILAHEIAGHAIVHALPRHGDRDPLDEAVLVQELIGGLSTLGLVEPWASIWPRWMEEMVADVCAVLTMGPAFALNLAAWISGATSVNGPGEPTAALGNLPSAVQMGAGRVATEHPPVLLRLLVMLGAMAAIHEEERAGRLPAGSGGSSRDIPTWRTTITDVISEALGAVDTIDLVDARSGGVLLTYALGEVTAPAFSVGKLIATFNLKALNSQKLVSVLAYSAADEAAVQSIARGAVAPGWAITGTVTQLLAGATKAVFDHPTQYGIVTQKLQNALDGLCPNSLTPSP